MALGSNQYPKTVATIHQALAKYGDGSSVRSTNTTRDKDTNLTLAQIPEEDMESTGTTATKTAVPGTNGVCNPMIKCYKYNRHGHIRAYYPSATQVQAAQMICAQSDKSVHLSNTWLLLGF